MNFNEPFKAKSDSLYSFGYASNEYINITHSGNLRLDQDSHPRRPKGRKDYLLIYNIEGNCYVTIDGKEQIAEKGDIVLYRPGEPQDYRFSIKEHPHNYWVHFSGAECEKIFKESGLENTHILKLSQTHEIEYLLGRLCNYFEINIVNHRTICNGLLIAVLGLIGAYNTETGSIKNNFSNRNTLMVSEVITRMKMRDTFIMNVAECAKYCNMSIPYFSRIFKSITGLAPQQFIKNMKMERAKELLIFSDSNISYISHSVGYEDPNFFSRAFKQHFGVTPKEYRNQHTTK